MYDGDPTLNVLIIFLAIMTSQKPKSIIFGYNYFEMIIFAGLMSRWIMQFWVIAKHPAKILRKIDIDYF